MALVALSWDPISDIGKSAADAVFGELWQEIGSACQSVTAALWHAVTSSTDISFSSSAWTGAATQGLLGVVGELSAALMLLMVMLAIIRAVARGEPAAAARAVVVDLPISCIGAVALVGITAVITAASDQAADAIMHLGPSAAMTSFAANFPTVITSLQFVGGLGGILFLLGAFMVWLELLVRAGLVYLMVATGPLLLAMRVHPGFSPAWKKFAETGVAVIFSKVFVAVALVLGLALTTGGTGGGAAGTGQHIGQLLAGIGMMGLAAFAPFVLLRFVPVVEAALLAQGISRMPGRAAMQSIQMAYYGHGLARLAGTGGGAAAGAAVGTGPGAGPSRRPGPPSEPPGAPAPAPPSGPSPGPAAGGEGLPPAASTPRAPGSGGGGQPTAGSTGGVRRGPPGASPSQPGRGLADGGDAEVRSSPPGSGSRASGRTRRQGRPQDGVGRGPGGKAGPAPGGGDERRPPASRDLAGRRR